MQRPGGPDQARVRAKLEEAVGAFDTLSMALHAASARLCLGVTGNGAGAAELTAGARAWMASESVRAPLKIAAMVAPGFRRALEGAS
jgi:hypothetical protein